MKLCPQCKGIGSIPVDPAKPNNTRRCPACTGTGIAPSKGENPFAPNAQPQPTPKKED
jgi:DnaJ-class molecular chaperone